MDDLVKRLRDWETVYPCDNDKPDGSLYVEAADRIKADAKRIAKLKDDLIAAQNLCARLIEHNVMLSRRAEAAEARVKVLEDALRWCSGSDDFSDGGKARDGWLKICAPLICRDERGGDT